MLAIILSVLKIIGIVLLSILGLFIFFILLVLFVPIRYSVTAFKNEDENDNYNITARFSFLLHILNGKFTFPSENKVRIRLFCFRLYPKKVMPIKPSKIKKSKNLDKSDSKIDSSINEDDDEIDDGPSIEELEASVRAQKYDSKAETVRSIAHEINEEAIDDNPTIRKFIDKIIDFAKNIKDKVISIGNKIKDIHDNIEYYLDLINSDLFQRSYALCKKQLLKLLKSIRPRKVKGLIHFGNDDPQTAGMVFGLYSTVYPYIGKSLVYVPHFEDKIFTANIYLRGRITVFTILVVAIKVYFNKDIKRTLKLLKKEK